MICWLDMCLNTNCHFLLLQMDAIAAIDTIVAINVIAMINAIVANQCSLPIVSCWIVTLVSLLGVNVPVDC